MNYLSAHELAELVGCKPNQRTIMSRWLDEKHWKYETDKNGLPKVARAFHDKKLGISGDNKAAKLADGPNLQAFHRRDRH
ncbi:MAG TPA: DUF4224 domain-containing protein [Burkholderiaceae bacterium]